MEQSLGDVAVAMLLGVVGFFMIVFDYSRIALIIGVLVFFTRPISLAFLLALAVTLAYPALQRRRRGSDVG